MMRVGIGFDAHRFTRKRKLFLGGVEIPSDRGLTGHSDADVLLHALGDALLGAAGLGDLGTYFPDTDARWKDVSSSFFLKRILAMLHKKHFRLLNADVTVIAQIPRITRHRSRILASLSRLLGISEDAINLKATTTDSMGFTGRKEGIAAQAVVLIEKKDAKKRRKK
jgi:2-C-methyl-D-erythritol 2,4-cyclodiphosphate synthase